MNFPHGRPFRSALAGLALLAGCAGSRADAPGPTTPTAASPNEAAPSGAPREALAWADLTPATFAKAKAERRFIVLDGSAEWCHWCHVMEATTYHDPRVKELLAKSFIAVKVDVDARPDIEERYGAWGWPATVLFSPDAEEIGKYRGYIAPDDFAEILRQVAASGGGAGSKSAPTKTSKPASASGGPLTEETLAWIAHATEVELDEYYDEKHGSWGRTQKVPLYWDNTWALSRARAGDAKSRERVLFTLDQERAVLDPVWGGVYQYSTDGDWNHPHFEKLMPFEAGTLDNYADAYLLTGDRNYLATAQAIRGYIDAFLMAPDGGFYATQDADLNAHETGKRYVAGHEYYALDDAHRRALGVPRVDTHEYAKENGLAIAAYATLYEASCREGQGACDTSALARAERAAALVLATHASSKGGVAHDATPDAHVLHLGDNAAFGWGLARLHDVTHKAAYLDSATKIADFMVKDLVDAEGGGFFSSTVDPDAVGVFQVRRVSFEDNVLAVRFLAKLVRAKAPASAAYERAIGRALHAIATPEEIKSRGRMIGDFLLALEETKGAR